MKQWMKWTLAGVAAAVVLGVATATLGYQMAASRMARHVAVNARPVALVSDTQSLQRGKYLFLSRGCTDCHGEHGGGRTFVEKDGLHIAGPNITPGGVVRAYQPADWDRAIRHGVRPDGRPLMVMPSEDYNRLTDGDLAALVGYMRTLPSMAGGEAIVKLPVPVRVAYGLGAIKDAAARIDHSLPPQQPVAEAVNAQHGAYVAAMCIGCHGEKLSGGKVPGGPPDWPPAANLTPGEGSAMSRYPDDRSFLAMMRSGRRPDGTAIAVMPFGSLARMSDVDLQALFAYLRTVPARSTGGN